MTLHDLRIVALQYDIVWQDREANLTQLDGLIDNISDSDIIVLPEMFALGFSMSTSNLSEDMNGPTKDWLVHNSARLNTAIIGSSIIKDKENYFNRLFFVKPSGEINTYDKRHLFRMANENQHYTAGSERLIVDYKGWKICPLICYDLRFPVWSRNINQEYDCLIYIANWPEPRINAWSTLLQARAIENQCFVVGVNRVGLDGNKIKYSGNSSIVDPKGQILVELEDYEIGKISCSLSYFELSEFRKKFPVVMDADKFELVD